VFTLGAAGVLAAGMAVTATGPVSADYGPHAQYQVEISSNPSGFGFWVWAELDPGGTSGDYQETDCIHLGGGHATDAAAHDSGSVSGWSVDGGALTMTGVNIIGNLATANFSVGPVGTNGYGHIHWMTLTVTSEVAPFFPLNVPLTFPATGVVAP
jgi:hypothetical protein